MGICTCGGLLVGLSERRRARGILGAWSLEGWGMVVGGIGLLCGNTVV